MIKAIYEKWNDKQMTRVGFQFPKGSSGEKTRVLFPLEAVYLSNCSFERLEFGKDFDLRQI